MATRHATGRSGGARALRISERSSSTEILARSQMTENRRCGTGTLRMGRAVRAQNESGLTAMATESRSAKATLTDSGRKSWRSIRRAMKTESTILGKGLPRRRLRGSKSRMKGIRTRNPPPQQRLQNRELWTGWKGNFRRVSWAVERGRGKMRVKMPARLPTFRTTCLMPRVPAGHALAKKYATPLQIRKCRTGLALRAKEPPQMG